MSDNTHNTFVPLDSQLTADVWETELDRIQVLRVYDDFPRHEFWIRLIGPGRYLNFRLQLPVDDEVKTVMKVTRDLLPDDQPELVEYNEKSVNRYFADVYVFLRQQGLDQWTLTKPPRDCRHGLGSWT